MGWGFLQIPGFTQDYIRYSYVLNNPLSYIDPTGNLLVSWELMAFIDYLLRKSGSNGGTWSPGGGFQNFSYYDAMSYAQSHGGGSIVENTKTTITPMLILIQSELVQMEISSILSIFTTQKDRWNSARIYGIILLPKHSTMIT